MAEERGDHPADCLSRDLRERVKELECLFRIARILGTHRLSLRQMLERIVEVIPPAWQEPERTWARIRLRDLSVVSRGYAETPLVIGEPLRVGDSTVGLIETGVLPPASPQAPPAAPRPGGAFLENERKLLAAIAGMIENTVLQKEAAAELGRAAAGMEAQKVQLEHKNIALREILAQVEVEKRELAERVAANVEQLALPLIRRLRDDGLSAELRQRYLDLLERNLGELASSYSRRLMSDRVRLSPREMEVAAMVRDGFSSKEIAGRLNVSELTVERHRHNIRRKLGISSERVNLSTYLRQL